MLNVFLGIFRCRSRPGQRPRLRGLLLALSGAWIATVGHATPSLLMETPLTARTSAVASPLFTELPSAQTGIVTTNNYTDPQMWGALYHEFEIGEMGTGVAIGDFDGDGRPDLFVVSKTESCRLFRNLGDFKFEDVTERAGVADHGAAAAIWKQGATWADVNNDGRLDLYVCRFNAPNLLYVNQGDGTFKEMAQPYGLDLKDGSGMAAFCDYDRDGWLDVFVHTNLLDNNAHPNGQKSYLFHNNRDGTFSNVTDHAGISGESQVHSATWWDFDQDGWPDLYVANDFAAPDKLYRNNRDGTFTEVIDHVVPHLSYSAMGADLGDVNNDGLIDFFVVDMAATTHALDQRTMANARSQARDLPDGATQSPQLYRNALYVNTGAGRMLEAAFLAGIAATDWAWSARFEDLDNDGRLDLFVTNGMHREVNNADLLTKQMKAESPAERLRIMHDSPVLAQQNFAYQNRGDFHFADVSQAWGLNQKGVSFGAAFGDFDGDGNLDLVYANYHAGVTVLRNNGGTGHRVTIALRGVASNRLGVGATVRIESVSGKQVRQLVLARGYLSSSEPMIHFGLGTDTVIKNLTVEWPSGLLQTFSDLKVDEHFVISEPSGPVSAWPKITPVPRVPDGQFTEVSESSGLSLASREIMVDETAQQPLLPFRLNRRGPSVAIGNVRGDDRDGLVLGGTTATPLRIVWGLPGGSFPAFETASQLPLDAIDDGPVLLFDAQGLGRSDLLVTKGGNSLPAGSPEYQPRIFFNDGHGGFSPASASTLPDLAISVGALAAADFTRAGRLGVFIGGRLRPGQYPETPESALLINRGGTFQDITDSFAPGLRHVGMVTSALWTDFDGDGWPDLLLTLDWGHVKCFHNDLGQRLDDWTEKMGFAKAGTGWWTAIATADFNGDGRPDYVVGNVGLNTQYHADPMHPAVLFYGDFNGEGEQPQLIEGTYEGDRLYPWRSQLDLGASIPDVLKRFPHNNPFATATLEQIFGGQKLSAAVRLAATELRSGVFLSQPDGTYQFEPLPQVAQISPIQGLVAGDFDGDGHADIYAVQNSHAPVPCVGRFDGGLSQLLRGDGQGHFTPVWPVESGLMVTNDAKALAVADLNHDGWPDFVVSRNNSTSLAFQNRGVPGRHMIAVRLRGAAGNPTGVGARVTVEFADGTSQSAEIGCGGGWASQSTAACFFGYSEVAPRKAVVHWPSGGVTEHAVDGHETTVVFSSPASN